MPPPAAVGAVRAATTLALWSAARRGGASSDDVLAALDATGFRAGVRAATDDIAGASGLPGPGAQSAGTSSLLPLMSTGGAAELLLPKSGDLRGLPPRGPVTVPALDAGAVVVFPDAQVGLIPEHGQWRAYHCAGGVAALPLTDAHREIDLAVAVGTQELARADIARGAERVRDRVRELMLAEAVDCPRGTPGPASALLAKVISLQALLEVARGHETAAVTSGELALVDRALEPLAQAIRDGRRAAVAYAVSELIEGRRVTGAPR